MKKIIELLKIGEMEESILKRLKYNLGSVFDNFNISVNITQDMLSLDKAEFNSERRQYNADKILKKIINYSKNSNALRILGVLDKDVYSEPLNFVFGIAIKPNRRTSGVPVVALISITRLREQFYRRPENNDIFELRVLKEAVHELGHTFSLEHCNKFCIMRFSNSLTDTDEKPKDFCNSCLKRLKSFFNL
jgi:archaemetzincin